MEATEHDAGYWGPERASYEDELDAWRERTARPVVSIESAAAVSGHAVIGGLFGRSWRPVRTPDTAIHAQSPFGAPPDEVLAA